MRTWVSIASLAAGIVVLGGCQSSSPDTIGFAQVDSAVVEASFPDTWDFAKTVLRENDYIIYTRDKRGLFIAYTNQKRRRLVPSRTQFTVTLEPVTGDTTKVTIESIDQKYGVTLLTYPAWHDRPTEDNSQALALLEQIQSKAAASGGP